MQRWPELPGLQANSPASLPACPSSQPVCAQATPPIPQPPAPSMGAPSRTCGVRRRSTAASMDWAAKQFLLLVFHSLTYSRLCFKSSAHDKTTTNETPGRRAHPQPRPKSAARQQQAPPTPTRAHRPPTLAHLRSSQPPGPPTEPPPLRARAAGPASPPPAACRGAASQRPGGPPATAHRPASEVETRWHQGLGLRPTPPNQHGPACGSQHE